MHGHMIVTKTMQGKLESDEFNVSFCELTFQAISTFRSDPNRSALALAMSSSRFVFETEPMEWRKHTRPPHGPFLPKPSHFESRKSVCEKPPRPPLDPF